MVYLIASVPCSQSHELFCICTLIEAHVCLIYRTLVYIWSLSCLEINLCDIYLSYSQVDYRAKLWACNFCFQRNQVCNLIICIYTYIHFVFVVLFWNRLYQLTFLSTLVISTLWWSQVMAFVRHIGFE